ncbi:protein elf4-like 3, partial [Phtheirospermum japonicum]
NPNQELQGGPIGAGSPLPPNPTGKQQSSRSKIPRNLSTNVELIREINANISEVVGLYSDLSESFSGII